jgi:general secretion pathway protein I
MAREIYPAAGQDAAKRVSVEVRRREAGFTLIEALVALAVLAASIVAIGTLFATNVRATRSLEDRLSLLEMARTVMGALPDRGKMGQDILSGELNGYQWRFDLLPFEANSAIVGQHASWEPEVIVVTVRSPAGQLERISTIRLRRLSEGNR